MVEDYRDEADAAEDLEHEPDVQATEIPEADALEQASELDPEPDEPGEVGDAPEADALDQQRPVSGDTKRRPPVRHRSVVLLTSGCPACCSCLTAAGNRVPPPTVTDAGSAG
jgi:hypothetical protein